MTRFFIFVLLKTLFRDADLSPDAAALDISLVHRLRENWRHPKLAAIRRFNLIIDLECAARHGRVENRVILAHVDVIDAGNCRNVRPQRLSDQFESAWLESDT